MWHNTWTGILCVWIYKEIFFVWKENHIQRKTDEKQVRNWKIVAFIQWENAKKNHPMVPPLDPFQGKNENCSSFAKTISTSRRSFFANLNTFERHSGLKDFSLLKMAILKMWWLSKFQSHRSWGDDQLSLGVAQAPPKLKWDQPKTYEFWQSFHFQNP